MKMKQIIPAPPGWRLFQFYVENGDTIRVQESAIACWALAADLDSGDPDGLVVVPVSKPDPLAAYMLPAREIRSPSKVEDGPTRVPSWVLIEPNTSPGDLTRLLERAASDCASAIQKARGNGPPIHIVLESRSWTVPPSGPDH